MEQTRYNEGVRSESKWHRVEKGVVDTCIFEMGILRCEGNMSKDRLGYEESTTHPIRMSFEGTLAIGLFNVRICCV
jgi:hypothetical protein